MDINVIREKLKNVKSIYYGLTEEEVIKRMEKTKLGVEKHIQFGTKNGKKRGAFQHRSTRTCVGENSDRFAMKGAK